MTEGQQNGGFAWRVRLGDLLTMLIVAIAAVGLAFQTFTFYTSLLDRISEKYQSLSERLAKVEAKVDILSVGTQRK